MAKLTPPAWAPDAVPTRRGWVKPNKPGKEGNPELLHSMKIPQADIDEFFGEAAEPKAVSLNEAPRGHTALADMEDHELDAVEEQKQGILGSLLKG